MFVAGATQSDHLKRIRSIVPEHFLLVPGVGFQGGSLLEVSREAMNTHVGLLVNVSRAIIYASKQEDFPQEAAAIAQQYQVEMGGYLAKFAATS
jgi:orotidine-5'-phosphate decarboxylase